MKVSDVLARLDGVRATGPGGWMGKCPVHEDSDPSLSVGTGEDGKILLNCFAGCETEEIARSIGLDIKDLMAEKPDFVPFPPERVSLPALARKTALPQEYLETEIGLIEKNREVLVPYRDEEGNHIYYKRRVALDGKGKYRYEPGSKLVPYGRWKLPEARENRFGPYLFMPEGETDCWTFWNHGVSALGVPGANAAGCVTAEDVRGIKKIYMIQEPGNGGSVFVEKLGRRLREIGYTGRLSVVKCPEGVKDPNELHTLYPTLGFMEILREITAEAKEWTEESDLSQRVRCAADIKPAKIDFLWRPRIPIGVVTLLAGKPGLGKSVFTAWLSSVISRGGDYPEEGPAPEPSGTLLFSAEDDEGSIIIPRLAANSADLKRIHIYDLNQYDFSLNEESFRVLDQLVVQLGPRLVILDPLVSFVEARVDINKANEVRALLRPLAALAKRRKVAVLVVAHVKKGNVSLAVDSVMGSLDFVAAARSALIITEDPEKSGGKVVAHSKHNTTRPADSLRFHFEDSHEFEQPQLVWDGVCNLSADQLAMQTMRAEDRYRIANAETFLLEELSGGPVSTKTIQKSARSYGITGQTIEQACQRIGIRFEKIDGEYYYLLPGATDPLGLPDLSDEAPF